MERQIKFTQARLEQLACPEGKSRTYFQDTVRPELLLQVTRTGSKSYYCRGWNRATGYTDLVRIDKFEKIDIKTAKKSAIEIANLLAQGIDPRAEKKALKQEASFSEAFEYFITDPISRRKKGPRRERTTKGYQGEYRRYLEQSIGLRKLSTLKRAEIDELHLAIGKNNGIYAANRTVALISGVFNDAILRGWKGLNPAQGIERFPEKRRKRFLREDEIGPFIETCEIERSSSSRVTAEAALLALFTGARRGNVCGASWHDIDLERAAWSIPEKQMKNKEPHIVYLCNYAHKILVCRYRERESKDWVFPGTGQAGHLRDPKKGIKVLAERARISPKGVHMHSLRHTFLTYADDICLPASARKRLAAHKQDSRADVTDRYTHPLERRVREAYEKVADHMLEIAGAHKKPA